MEVGVKLELEVYIDVIFLINFIMDFILLLIVRKIIKSSGKIKRLLGGAVVGAIGACVLTVMSDLNGLIQFLLSYVIICTLMICASFRFKNWKEQMRAVLVLYLSTFLLGGVMNSLYYYSRLGYYFQELIQGRLLHNRNPLYLVLSGATAFLLLPLFMKIIYLFRRGKQELYPTELFYRDKSVQLVGLLDTGNDLHDPIYGKPVLVAEYSAVEPLLNESQAKELQSMLDTFEGKSKILVNEVAAAKDGTFDKGSEERLNIMMIPYHSIGKENGMLPAFIMNRIVISEGREQVCNEKVLTAVSRNKLSGQNEYQIILHKDML